MGSVGAFDRCLKAASEYSAIHDAIRYAGLRAHVANENYEALVESGASVGAKHHADKYRKDSDWLVLELSEWLEEARSEYQAIWDECFDELSEEQRTRIAEIIIS